MKMFECQLKFKENERENSGLIMHDCKKANVHFCHPIDTTQKEIDYNICIACIKYCAYFTVDELERTLYCS